MPKKKTRIASPYDPAVTAASGLHDPDRAQSYMFVKLRQVPTPINATEMLATNGRPLASITVGRDDSCQIHLRDDHASGVHVILKRQPNGSMVVHDQDSTNGVFVDGEPMSRPFVLEVGMRLKLGHARLYALDASCRYPIIANTIDELMQQAARIYGNFSVAGDRVGVSRESIRRRIRQSVRRRV